MKKVVLALFLAGCSSSVSCAYRSSNIDAGITKNEFYIQDRAKEVYEKYYPVCVRNCYGSSQSEQCPDKCRQDMKQIIKVLVRAINENREQDFNSMMESFYGE
jgi:hypothetical protein